MPATAGRRRRRARSRAAPAATLKADLDVARQAAVSDLIEETNADIEDSSEMVLRRHQRRRQGLLHDPGRYRGGGDRDLAQDLPESLGLQRLDFGLKTTFAYRDPGSPYLPSILFLIGSIPLFVIHMFLLGMAERRRPLTACTSAPRARASSPGPAPPGG